MQLANFKFYPPDGPIMKTPGRCDGQRLPTLPVGGDIR
jgi:hypothetical protein